MRDPTADPPADPTADPTAEQRVRLALPSEAAAIGALQVAAWQHGYAGQLPAEVLAGLDVAGFADAWRRGIVRSAEARSRVLVALQHQRVVGFAATTMSDDPDARAGGDGLITEFCVDPGHRHDGHGSRLLNAVIDTMRTDGFTRATIWLSAADDGLREFLGAAGWQPDGAHRELDLRGDAQVRVKQLRLHCAIADG